MSVRGGGGGGLGGIECLSYHTLSIIRRIELTSDEPIRKSWQYSWSTSITSDNMCICRCPKDHTWFRHHCQFFQNETCSETNDVHSNTELSQGFGSRLQLVDATVRSSAYKYEQDLFNTRSLCLGSGEYANSLLHGFTCSSAFRVVCSELGHSGLQLLIICIPLECTNLGR